MVPWRQSAALIMLGKNQANGRSLFDYSMLLLKRSPKMRFAPDMSAFPGGRLDPCDLSPEWPEYLSSLMKIDRFARKTADIYEDIDHPYPGLAFRLCAIRETFEETGLLLAKPCSSTNPQNSPIMNLSNDMVDQWRDKIRHDASQFLVMCKAIQIQPDVQSLYEWNQFLAAAVAKVRFDTIFYITALPKTYPCLIADDDHESVSAEWLEADTAMNNYRQSSINLLPPQIYELHRLANFRKLSSLVGYLIQCENNPKHRIKRLLGVCYSISDAILLFMPGDDFYPADASFTTPVISSDKALKDFDSPRQNRLVMLTDGERRTWQVYYKNGNEKSKLDIQPVTNLWSKL